MHFVIIYTSCGIHWYIVLECAMNDHALANSSARASKFN